MGLPRFKERASLNEDCQRQRFMRSYNLHKFLSRTPVHFVFVCVTVLLKNCWVLNVLVRRVCVRRLVYIWVPSAAEAPRRSIEASK
jgi:hypothetical protein